MVPLVLYVMAYNFQVGGPFAIEAQAAEGTKMAGGSVGMGDPNLHHTSCDPAPLI